MRVDFEVCWERLQLTLFISAVGGFFMVFARCHSDLSFSSSSALPVLKCCVIAQLFWGIRKSCGYGRALSVVERSDSLLSDQ